MSDGWVMRPEDVPAEAVELLNRHINGTATRQERFEFHYRAMAGPFCGPNRHALAVVLAYHLVERKDFGE